MLLGLIKHNICLSTLPSHGCTLNATLHDYSLQAIHNGTRLHVLWQRPFLIHKSQKDQFKIYEQSVLQQPMISVTVGQCRHSATERKVLPPPVLQKNTHTHKHSSLHMHTQKEKVKRMLEQLFFQTLIIISFGLNANISGHNK